VNHIILFNNCVIIIPENKLITFEINNSFTNKFVIMDKNRNTIPQKETEDMLKEKTNQDFNNQKPNPMDPNQNKNHQTVEDDNDGNSQTETKKGAKRKRIKSKL